MNEAVIVERALAETMCRCPICGGRWFFEGDTFVFHARASMHPKHVMPCMHAACGDRLTHHHPARHVPTPMSKRAADDPHRRRL